ncbi:MAG: hypothetical protein H0V09_00790 [Gemmatimonadetes bacterium]|nr:hypothetical protein [Gemmatimonadota bacterium]
MTLRVREERGTYELAGVVSRKYSDGRAPSRVGVFTTHLPEVTLGTPRELTGSVFEVLGRILPPTAGGEDAAYRVVLSVEQRGQILWTGVPAEGGEGLLRHAPQRFLHRFTVSGEPA